MDASDELEPDENKDLCLLPADEVLNPDPDKYSEPDAIIEPEPIGLEEPLATNDADESLAAVEPEPEPEQDPNPKPEFDPDPNIADGLAEPDPLGLAEAEAEPDVDAFIDVFSGLLLPLLLALPYRAEADCELNPI